MGSFNCKKKPQACAYPGKWECGGGHVKQGEGFEAALKRQFFEEFGIDVDPQELLEIYEIQGIPAQRVIPGLRFLCVATADAQVRLNRREFSVHRRTRFPVPKLPWIEGVKKMLNGLAPQLADATSDKPRLLRKPPGTGPASWTLCSSFQPRDAQLMFSSPR